MSEMTALVGFLALVALLIPQLRRQHSENAEHELKAKSASHNFSSQ